MPSQSGRMWSDERWMSSNGSISWRSSKQAAEHLGVSLSTLYKLVNDGEVVAYRPSRSLQFKLEDLDSYLEGTRVQPGDLDHLVRHQRRPAS